MASDRKTVGRLIAFWGCAGSTRVKTLPQNRKNLMARALGHRKTTHDQCGMESPGIFYARFGRRKVDPLNGTRSAKGRFDVRRLGARRIAGQVDDENESGPFFRFRKTPETADGIFQPGLQISR